MGIMKKIGDGMGSVKDKTGEFIDTTSFKSKIGDEKRNIEDNKAKLGEFYWEYYTDGHKLADGAAKFIKDIEASLERIKEYEAEIEKIKSKDDDKKSDKEDKAEDKKDKDSKKK